MDYIQTVTGRIPAADLGFTLPHEHTGIDIPGEPNPWDWWNLFNDEAVIVEELADYKAHGGRSLVDLTNNGLGRDPVRIKRISERTGIQIVMGCGWYRGALGTPESRLDDRTTDELAHELVDEFEHGVGSTGIRPGVIGEIGTDKRYVNAIEERVFRAVARASRATGLAVMTHAAQSRVGLEQIKLLREDGVDPGRIVIGHVDSYPDLDYHLAMLDTGAFIEYDFLGVRFGPVDAAVEPKVIAMFNTLIGRGYAGQLLLSHDVGLAMQLKAYGGTGYTYVQETFLPRLRERGVSDAVLTAITVDNPRRVLELSEGGH
jgi:predicted metal-dependent phosphotriesterase family hydrolase